MFFAKPRDNKKENDYNIISPETKIEGKIYSPVPIKIDGIFSGEIVSRKEVVIGKEGVVRANIKTRNVLIEGNFSGNIILSGAAKITSTGKLSGNIIQMNTCLNIEDGGLFKGKHIITDNKEIFETSNKSIVSHIRIKPRKMLEY